MFAETDFSIDVTHAVNLGEPAQVAVTVTLPNMAVMPERPIVCFAKTPALYSRRYYTHDLPGPARGAQARWHAERGWIFVSLDFLGSGGSSLHDADKLGFAVLMAAAFAAEQEILLRLANGVLFQGFPPIHQPVKIGMGPSSGACLTIAQQARYRCYDGIVALGFSAIHSHPANLPGGNAIIVPWVPRDWSGESGDPVANQSAVNAAATNTASDGIWQTMAWNYFYDDVPDDVVDKYLIDIDQIRFGAGERTSAELSPWCSRTTPLRLSRSILTPGVVAAEAAAIDVPVLSAMGVRDFVIDPPGEPRAFKSAPSVDIFICPRMGHMHNYASTRVFLWQRIEKFGEWCTLAKSWAN
jgi:hypothetical protein